MNKGEVGEGPVEVRSGLDGQLSQDNIESACYLIALGSFPGSNAQVPVAMGSVSITVCGHPHPHVKPRTRTPPRTPTPPREVTDTHTPM